MVSQNQMILPTLPKVKKRGSLNSPFDVPVQFPDASRHQRSPSIELLVSEEYLPSRRNGSRQTDVWTFYQKPHFVPALLLSEEFSLIMTLFNLFTLLESLACTKWMSSLQPEYQKQGLLFHFEVVCLNHFHFRTGNNL